MSRFISQADFVASTSAHRQDLHDLAMVSLYVTHV